MDWVANELAIEVRCGAWDILTNGWGKAEIGICGLIRENGNGGKDKSYLGAFG